MQLLAQKKITAGFLPNIGSASITFYVVSDEDQIYCGKKLCRIHQLIAKKTGEQISISPKPGHQYDAQQVLKFVAVWLCTITDSLKLPIPQRYDLKRIAHRRKVFALTVPTFKFIGTHQINIVERMIGAATGDTQALIEFEDQIEDLLSKLSSAIPGANPRFILRAAMARGIPILPIAETIFQLGQGKRSRLLRSSMTDDVSVICANMVRYKHLMAEVLAGAGIPCLKGIAVVNEEQALAAAKKLGFPLVVKPNDLDGGVAVHCDLNSREELLDKLADVFKNTKTALIQRYMKGGDFRVIVILGRAVAVIERIPGQITGDGQLTVEELINEYNDQPFRGSQAHMPLKPLIVDQEAEKKMLDANVSLQSVLPIGKVLRLRSAANIAQGGLPIDVTHSCHPENLRLAELAAKAFRLDVAGIDLLIPDISQSWRAGNAAICEVNAAPVIGYSVTRHIYPMLIDALIEGDGRIPIVVVVSENLGSKFTARLLDKLSELFDCIGHAGSELTFTGHGACNAAGNLLTDMTSLLRNPDVDCIVCEFVSMDQLSQGLPVAQIDYVLTDPDSPPFSENGSSEVTMLDKLRRVIPYVSRLIVLDKYYESHWKDLPTKTPLVQTSSETPEDLVLADLTKQQNDRLHSRHSTPDKMHSIRVY